MRKARPIPSPRLLAIPRNQPHVPRPRHNQKIQQIPASRPAQMRMAESHDRVVGIVIPRAPVPVVVVGVRLKAAPSQTAPSPRDSNAHARPSRKTHSPGQQLIPSNRRTRPPAQSAETPPRSRSQSRHSLQNPPPRPIQFLHFPSLIENSILNLPPQPSFGNVRRRRSRPNWVFLNFRNRFHRK
jgi:hypothetical protein